MFDRISTDFRYGAFARMLNVGNLQAHTPPQGERVKFSFETRTGAEHKEDRRYGTTALDARQPK